MSADVPLVTHCGVMAVGVNAERRTLKGGELHSCERATDEWMRKRRWPLGVGDVLGCHISGSASDFSRRHGDTEMVMGDCFVIGRGHRGLLNSRRAM